ncbi:MAG TPA: hypothetical protein VNF48_08325 [Gammaproteobacteria bacterium]|nr:hypothetical protein [Gammaproteobacteria bacterium]
MNVFWWTSGHLGWGVFSLTVFTGIWWLFFDLCWRLLAIRIGRLLALMAIGWMLGIGCILFGFYLAS